MTFEMTLRNKERIVRWNPFDEMNFQAFIFKESERYHSPTLSLTAS